MSKYGHIGGLVLQPMNLGGDTVQSIAPAFSVPAHVLSTFWVLLSSHYIDVEIEM